MATPPKKAANPRNTTRLLERSYSPPGPGGSWQWVRYPAGGFAYRPDFLARETEAELLEEICHLPLQEATYHQWTAKRRIVSYGSSYDFARHRLDPAPPLPPFLLPLRAAIARWVDLPVDDFHHATIAEYRPGTPLGWHRDVPEFEVVAGVSLGNVARMRFRPAPRSSPRPAGAGQVPAGCIIDLAPRSGYILRDAARWKWQHAISPTKQQRYSITFRTLRR